MSYPAAMKDLYARLQGDLGFPRAFVRACILPDWWEDKLATDPSMRRMAELSISRCLGIPLGQLADPEAKLDTTSTNNVRFKRWDGSEVERLRPAVALGHRAATLALQAMREVPPFQEQVISAQGLRDTLLQENGYVYLEPLLDRVWQAGIPVLFLRQLPKGSRKVDGFVFQIDRRPVIVLSSPRQSPAFVIWYLAHELGHIDAGHLATGDLVDVSLSEDSGDPLPEEEEQANRYARHLVYGDAEHPGFTRKSAQRITGQKLAFYAQDHGPRCSVLPSSIVASYGFHTQDWGVSTNALKSLRADSGGPEAVVSALRKRVDLDCLSETDRRFFVQVLGLEV